MEIQHSVCLIVWWVKKQSHRLVIFYNFDWLIIVTGTSLPPRQPRQLPWLIFETIIDYKKWPKQLGSFQEKYILIFLPSKKTP